MPDTVSLQEVVADVYEKYKDVDEGEVATYIPELGKANPDHFGICLATVDGQVFSRRRLASRNSPSSPCASPSRSRWRWRSSAGTRRCKHVGVEPSGDAFNSIELDPKTMRPFNPMINAGAIAIASLIKQDSGAGRRCRRSSTKCKRPRAASLRIDEAVLASETATGNRNRAIAYLMLNFGIIDEEVDHTLHQYFSQCSLLVNCRDLAMMAATLANMGTNPVTGERVFDFQYIKDVLTVMFTCGLYDYAGDWAYRRRLAGQERRGRRHLRRW